jgi:solute carrier family 12 sodium/potassium/chloride transporter 2
MRTASAEPGAHLASGHGFGTAPVYLASISTILGAILFLRFGYAVGNVGLVGALLIVLIGHLVTMPTALAISEIATNRRVEGGGEYFIISRSFGRTIGATIGIGLYLSQAISVAFYMIAFAEAFRPLAPAFETWTGIAFDPRLVSLPATGLLVVLVLARGADLGVRALWGIAIVLGVALACFFLGRPLPEAASAPLAIFHGVERGDPFMLVFAIVFPAFTGMTAGVGLSGDLRNPRRSIPLGVLSATVTGLVVYVAVVAKLALSAPAQALASEPLIMAKIAIWGPVVPIGLACATLSSALGSILVGPRTLQALAGDGVTRVPAIDRFLTAGHGPANEPRRASLVTSLIAVVTVGAGNIDFVARMVSMFFMVTYGSLCAISFLEHLAARPSFRPSFRSKWYLSLLGAVLCFLLMFQMDPGYALLAILVMAGIYVALRATEGGQGDLAEIFRSVMTQTTRHFQIQLQRTASSASPGEWRPNLIAVGERTFERAAPLQLLTWLCRRQGFGTYLHLLRGRLDADTYRQAEHLLPRLVDLAQTRHSALVVDTLVSPSLRTALAQAFQMPSVTGREHNATLFEFTAGDGREFLEEIRDGCTLAWDAGISPLLLRHGERFFGSRRDVHVWLTWHDYGNAPLMILLAYILLGHPDWSEAEIRIFAAFPQEEAAEQRRRLIDLVETGRLPIAAKNLRIIPTDQAVDFDQLVARRSAGADLTILGLTRERLEQKGTALLGRHPELGDVLFVSAVARIPIE